MAERNRSDDQAAFGVFPQLKRNRSKQDREAAKNVPVDLARGAISGVLGAPGDIESLVRMLPYLNEKTVLPTSEDIEKKLPFKSDTPVSRAATGLGQLGGGFYYGPGSPLKVVGALPGALKHGAEEFAKASVAGAPHVVKPKGGNWLGGQDRLTVPENDLRRLKTLAGSKQREAELLAEVEEATKMGDQGYLNAAMADLQRVRSYKSVNDWVDRNLTNYVKKEMGTPEDPVRKLAEQGIIHTPLRDDAGAGDYIRALRVAEGFPAEGMGRSPLAKQWEDLADDSIRVTKAGAIQDQANTGAKLEKARAELEAHKQQIDQDFLVRMSDHTGNSIFSPKEAEMLLNMPFVQKAEILGDTKYRDLQGNVNELLARESGFEKAAGDLNPFVAKLDPETRLYSGSTYDLGFDHIVDVLREDVAAGRIRPEQLNKVSMEQAVRRTFEYDQEMAKKMAEAAIKQTEGFPTYKEYPEGYRWLELAMPKPSENLPQGWTMIEPKGGVMRAVNEAGDRVIGNDMPELIKNLYYRHPYTPGNPRQMLEEALKYEGDTMGHCVGGYCPDVVEGKSRIFSLRDSKGEPHVTVEVQPKGAVFSDVAKYIGKEEADRLLDQGVTLSEMIKNIPDFQYPQRIQQIKGKGNAKPKEDYLPYVQDFVKGGKWTEIGDFQNTGLIREGGQLMTPAEHSDWLLKQLDVPPAEGMKRGGVVVSNNPDAMMLELNDRKMAGGGLTNLVKGAKAALKAEPEIMKASEALGKIEGRPLVITQADRTKVGEGYLGGPGFSSLQLTEPEYRAAEAAWGVKTPGVAKMILGGAKKAGDKSVFTTMIGSPTQHQSNQMVFDKLYGDFKKAAKKGGLPTELRDKINDRLVKAVDKEGNPVFPADIDILDKKFKDIANTFDRRSIAGHLMGGVQVGGKKGQIIDYDKIIRETTDPALIDVPSGSLGNRLFTLSGGIIDRPDLHPAFPTILQGEDLGLQFSPVAKDILMRDFIEKTMREKGRKPGYMDFTRGYPPSQLITEDILTEMQKLGLKEGGAVKKPAAYIDGSEFWEAAKKYGIRDSMENLNKIVDLVNKGFTVDDAARQVADTGMHKAAGGAITGDDLIIEERPL
jgi:hypothetical protein